MRAAPLLNTLTITPDSADCGTNAICTGQTGTATVTVLGLGGASAAGRAVKFDVLAGPFLVTTGNPAQPLVTSLTVFTDARGVASVIIKANANAPTQFGAAGGYRPHVGTVRPVEDIKEISEATPAKIDNKELELGQLLAENLVTEQFDISQYSDSYATELKKLIEAESKGKTFTIKQEEPIV